eukprot:scaffold149_cov383-Prasinococcus_capsulatus_cf.AAC.1
MESTSLWQASLALCADRRRGRGLLPLHKECECCRNPVVAHEHELSHPGLITKRDLRFDMAPGEQRAQGSDGPG